MNTLSAFPSSENLQMTVLGSGSSGNCTYVETPRIRFLVDAGLSVRQMNERLKVIGRSLEDVNALLITHEHTDHTLGLDVLTRKFQIPVYTNRLTADALRNQLSLPDEVDWRFFRSGDSFALEDVWIDSFSLLHDAYDPIGFAISWQKEKIGILTDLGYAPEPLLERVRGCTALLIETNHDLELLRADKKRPWSVKQRILGRHGHLSNEEAADVVEAILSDQLKHLFLCHLSRDCNRPELAHDVMYSRLKRISADFVSIHNTYPNRPCQSLTMGDENVLESVYSKI